MKNEKEPISVNTEIIKDAWLNLNQVIRDEDVINPIDLIPKDQIDLGIAWLFQQPEYFSFICKYVFNIELLPTQAMMLEELWNRKFPMLIASRGFGKSFMLSLYGMMRALLMPGRKIVVVGAAFRQSKVLFEYMKTIWYNAPVLRSMVSQQSGPTASTDMCKMTINNSTVTCLPLGDGTKIRGQRANDIITDEFAAVPEAIFETVVAGFAAVSASPIEAVKRAASHKKLLELGLIEDGEEPAYLPKDNQIIVAGTADYEFKHFGQYWRKWHQIIRSRGDKRKLQEFFGDSEVPEDFDWRHYSIIRIPYELLPDGFMDAASVARSKATVHSGIYQMEYGACFSSDSNGFFKRSLIERCTSSIDNKIVVGGVPVYFEPQIKGNPFGQYVFGVDPASEVDNFSIIVLDVKAAHNEIVLCWTTTRREHKEKLKMGIVEETDFYGYCARKIRDLMGVFPCIHIAMDKQGGGVAVMEALHDKDKIRENELPIWEVIDEAKEKDTDFFSGLHILELCQFADAAWAGAANHGLRFDFESQVTLFPYFDPASLGIGAGLDEIAETTGYDGLEDCILEIEELKNELSIIELTQTPSGRDKWDTPEYKTDTGKKQRLRKDRYSALIMANMAARTRHRTPTMPDMMTGGGFAAQVNMFDQDKTQKAAAFGPDWYCAAANNGLYD